MSDGKNRTRTCLRCGESKPADLMKKASNFWLCYYCHSVMLGEPDSRWLAGVEKQEKLPRGFQIK